MKIMTISKMTYAAVCLAMALVLPFATGQIPEIGSMLCPMHLPILLCGFLCGWKWGAATGFVAPLLRSLIFARPPLYPTAMAMAAELAVYGLVAGLLYCAVPKRIGYTYTALIGSMLCGRVIGGLVQLLLLSLDGTGYTAAIFFAEYFVGAWPGIVLQLVLIPLAVSALERAKLMPREKGNEHDGKTV